jgi:pilus assembly protein CpaC
MSRPRWVPRHCCPVAWVVAIGTLVSSPFVSASARTSSASLRSPSADGVGAEAPSSPERESRPIQEREVKLTTGESTTLTFPNLIKVIDIRTPSVATAKGGRTPAELRISAGEKAGIGEILVTDELGNRHRITVRVVPNVAQLKSALELAFPHLSLGIHPISETSVLVTGYVDDPRLVGPILEAASRYGVEVVNGLYVGGPQQIQLRLMVAEISRSKLRQLGANIFRANDRNMAASTVGGLSTVHPVANPREGIGAFPLVAPFLTGLTFVPDANLVYGFLDSDDEWRLFIRALKQEGLAKTLAEPVLVTTSGRPARFLDGGEFAIVVPQRDLTFTVEFRDFGVRLDFVPALLADGQIQLQVTTEVSRPDPTLGTAFQGTTVPGLRQRRAETSVTMRSGQTLAIAGLLQVTDEATTQKVPVLGDLPWVGAAFRTVEYERQERELLVLITPEVVAPVPREKMPCYGPGSESAPPTDRELFLLGRIERPASGPCEEQRRAWLEAGLLGRWERPGEVQPEGRRNGLGPERSGEGQRPEKPQEGQPEKSKPGQVASHGQRVAEKGASTGPAERSSSSAGLFGPVGFDQ